MERFKRNRPLVQKVLVTIGLLTLYRLGTLIPGPGIEAGTSTQPGDAVGTAILNMFTGGATARMSVFALGAMPFIMASIIMQLASIIFPWVAKQRKLGQDGADKLMQITRYLTIVMAAIQAISLVWVATTKTPDITGMLDLSQLDMLHRVGLAVGMIAGAIVIMRIGEIITEKGIGSGISLLIFTSIAASMPAQISATWGSADQQWQKWVLIAGIVVLLVVVTFVEGAQRRVPVRFARQKARTAGAGTYIPFRVNQSNVIPAIFASAILVMPVLINGWFFSNNTSNWWGRNVVEPSSTPTSILYIVSMVVLVIFFAYYYTFIQHNPQEQAESIAKGNGFIPGYAPGAPTAGYIGKVLGRLLLPGSIYLALVAVLPNVAIHFFSDGQAAATTGGVPFAGTGLLVLVSVALTTVATFRGELTKTIEVKPVMMPQGKNPFVRRKITTTLNSARVAIKE